MGFRTSKTVVIGALIAVICVAAVAYALASREEGGDPGAANPESAATDYEAALADAPPPLADLYAQGDAILEGGREAFEARLAELRGHPVVVNKWASWCGPCRHEFPFFQQVAAERGKEIAFLGVQSADSTAAGETFLEEFPLPYPSYSDPDDEIAELFKGFSWPSTAFYDARGELVYTRQGPYASAQDLEREIDRYVG
jgi:cytochrome c biogenesis protein CcmG, thiol:disulfide interchange protein DsbE